HLLMAMAMMTEFLLAMMIQMGSRDRKKAECIFREGILNFEGMHFEGMHFKKCILKECIFRECILRECNLRECILREGILRECTLRESGPRPSWDLHPLQSHCPLLPSCPLLLWWHSCAQFLLEHH
uniref:Uncharacterized protein n=1 Tax=Serinus canaria TaxID=9135 RepID=A0A8C9NDU8_SERCA